MRRSNRVQGGKNVSSFIGIFIIVLLSLTLVVITWMTTNTTSEIRSKAATGQYTGCYGQCKGDVERIYTPGTTCVGVDNVCYQCDYFTGQFKVSDKCAQILQLVTKTPTVRPSLTRYPTPTTIVLNTPCSQSELNKTVCVNGTLLKCLYQYGSYRYAGWGVCSPTATIKPTPTVSACSNEGGTCNTSADCCNLGTSCQLRTCFRRPRIGDVCYLNALPLCSSCHQGLYYKVSSDGVINKCGPNPTLSP